MDDLRGESAVLLERTRLGDQVALAELYGRYEPRLKRMVRKRMDPRLDARVSASDIIQDAYLDARLRFRHYSAERGMSFFTWLRWIVNQRLTDVHRRHLGAKRRDAARAVSLNARAGEGSDSVRLIDVIAESETSPSAAAIRGEALDALDRALAKLDPPDREILLLRHFEDLGNAESAAELGIQPAAASKRYIRALAKLRTLMPIETSPYPQ